jgi:DNA-directed RNA polymerase subunit RPC12/RpoP
MVKVIKTEPDKSVTKEIICKNCGSTLEYTPNDVYRDYFDGKQVYDFIKCPACTYEVRVKG